MLVNKQIYDECLSLFYRNTFHLAISDFPYLRRNRPTFIASVRHVTVLWRSTYADASLFYSLSKCPKLESLIVAYDLDLLKWCTVGPKTNKLFQEDAMLRKFSWARGFDKLVQLRGLRKVVVKCESDYADEHIPKNERDYFKSFLIRELTLPKPDPVSLLGTHFKRLANLFLGSSQNGCEENQVCQSCQDSQGWQGC